MKKLILLLLFLGLFSGVFADSISDYLVPSIVPLNQTITATGLFLDDNGENSGVLCSFFFFDDANLPLERATDEWTNSNGRFSTTSYILKEPIFQRGRTYSLRTECGNTFETASFVVGQKQEAFDFFGFKLFPQGVVGDYLYFTDKENTELLILIFVFTLLFVGAVVAIFWK